VSYIITFLYAFMNDDILCRMNLVYEMVMMECSCMAVIVYVIKKIHNLRS
jgi:hypothetical protein